MRTERDFLEFLEEYEIDFDEINKKIRKEKAKIVLLQFPDGLKQYSIAIVNYLKEKNKDVEFLIWFGSCYGACDLPVGLEKLKPKIDLIIQFGHNELMPEKYRLNRFKIFS